MRTLVPLLFAFALFQPLLLADSLTWDNNLAKAEQSLQTLSTLLDVAPFPEEVPGLTVAIANKTEQAVQYLNALRYSLEQELSLLSTDEQEAAMNAYSEVLVVAADLSDRLGTRYLDASWALLGTTYNDHYTAYYALCTSFDLPSRVLPEARAGWNIPG